MLAGGTHFVQIVEVIVFVIVETVCVVCVIGTPPDVNVCVTGQVVVVVYTITVVTTSCVDADEAALLLETTAEFPPDCTDVGVGLAVHFVQMVMTLVL